MAVAETPATRPLRILFSMRNFWYVKLFESVVRELARRGHHVHILAERGERNEHAQDWNAAAGALAREYPTISLAWAPQGLDDDWIDLRLMIRLGLDYLRFLEPEYAYTPVLGARARRRTPKAIVSLANTPGFRSSRGRRVISAALKLAERATPTDPERETYLAAHRADVVLVTPLLTLGSEQVEVLRIARRLGVPTALCVGSWDHLSSKALVRQLPDRVFVWNRTQEREAETLHHIPAGRVVVTGAQCFDQWFNRRPTLEREAFCRKVGLDPARPFILYVCSALFEGSPSEAEFVARWIAALRASGDPGLERAGILVRPHPKRATEWDRVDLSAFDNVSLWPPRATAPFDAPSKADYFDSMFHGAVTVGLNTSALIESGIVGRAVHTILLPEFYDNQEGTVHFHYLLDGGLLRSARDLPTHVHQLAASLAASDPAVHHNRAFIEAFVRPAGLDVEATSVFADAVEAMAAEKPVPVRDPMWVPALRAAMQPLMRRTAGTFADEITRARRYRKKALEREERIAALQAHRAQEKARILEERRLRHEAHVREREERDAAARAQKVAAKARAREEKLRSKEARVAASRRRKQRQALNERIATVVRRLARPFSESR